MTSITTIQSGYLISNSRDDINGNFTALNSGKVESSLVSTDATLGGASPSSTKLPVESAIKSYVDATASPVGKSWNEYATANSGTDSYTITVPGVTALVDGQTFKWKADVANTLACTLNVNGLGAISLVKNVSTAMATGDILVGQDMVTIYDATTVKMQVVSLIPPTYLNTFSAGTTTKDISSTTTTTIAHGLGLVPSRICVDAVNGSTGPVSSATTSRATAKIIGGVTYSIYSALQASSSVGNTFAANGQAFILFSNGADGNTVYTTGTVSVDATNITITWVKTSTPTGTASIMWEAQY